MFDYDHTVIQVYNNLNMASLSKLASHASKNLFSQQKFHQHVGRMILASASMRNLVTKNYFCAHIAQQSRFTPGKAITFVDMMTGVYVIILVILFNTTVPYRKIPNMNWI